MSLLHCSELSELEFSPLCPNQMHMATISSVTSKNLRKIKFSLRVFAATLNAFLGQPSWEQFDSCICSLADKLRKLGNKQTLEVEILVHLNSCPSVGYKEFLPKFREKGRVRVVEHLSRPVPEPVVCVFSYSCHFTFSESDSSELLDRTGYMAGRLNTLSRRKAKRRTFNWCSVEIFWKVGWNRSCECFNPL